MVMAALFSFAIGKFMTNKIGGITGDTLGATNEVIETGILFSMCILGKVGSWII